MAIVLDHRSTATSLTGNEADYSQSKVMPLRSNAVLLLVLGPDISILNIKGDQLDPFNAIFIFHDEMKVKVNTGDQSNYWIN